MSGVLASAGRSINEPLRRRLRRATDIVAAAGLAIVLAPAFAAIAGAVLLTTGRPVIFKQTRRGRSGVEFELLKFRSLSSETRPRDDGSAVSIKNIAPYPLFRAESDPRATSLGGFLRRHYLDELPQLWNVLRGDMSLVGPRPLRSIEVAALPAEAIATRESVRPGITGLWQVDPRRYDSIEQLIDLDRTYCATSTAGTDLLILWRTVWVVLHGEGG